MQCRNFRYGLFHLKKDNKYCEKKRKLKCVRGIENVAVKNIERIWKKRIALQLQTLTPLHDLFAYPFLNLSFVFHIPEKGKNTIMFSKAYAAQILLICNNHYSFGLFTSPKIKWRTKLEPNFLWQRLLNLNYSQIPINGNSMTNHKFLVKFFDTCPYHGIQIYSANDSLAYGVLWQFCVCFFFSSACPFSLRWPFSYLFEWWIGVKRKEMKQNEQHCERMFSTKRMGNVSLHFWWKFRILYLWLWHFRWRIVRSFDSLLACNNCITPIFRSKIINTKTIVAKWFKEHREREHSKLFFDKQLLFPPIEFHTSSFFFDAFYINFFSLYLSLFLLIHFFLLFFFLLFLLPFRSIAIAIAFIVMHWTFMATNKN